MKNDHVLSMCLVHSKCSINTTHCYYDCVILLSCFSQYSGQSRNLMLNESATEHLNRGLLGSLGQRVAG